VRVHLVSADESFSFLPSLPRHFFDRSFLDFFPLVQSSIMMVVLSFAHCITRFNDPPFLAGRYLPLLIERPLTFNPERRGDLPYLADFMLNSFSTPALYSDQVPHTSQ